MDHPKSAKSIGHDGSASDAAKAAAGTANNTSASKGIEFDDDDDPCDSYAVASKDLKSLVKWNIQDLSYRYPVDDAGIADEWESLVRNVEELGRRPKADDGPKLCDVDKLISRVIKFPQLCLDLKRNDPSITTLEVDWFRYPSGYPRPLGKALNGNTHVSTIKLELDTLFPRDGTVQRRQMVSFLKPLLHYIESGHALRKLVFVSYFGDETLPPRVVNSFLLAAAKSPYLEELEILALDMEIQTRTFCTLLKQTTSLRSLNADLSFLPLESGYATEMEQVADAFGSNGTLERIKLDSGWGRSEFVDLVLSRLVTHPCLKDLHLGYSESLCPQKFLQLVQLPALLQSPTSQLRALHLKGCAFSRDSMNDFVTGLTVSRTLEKLVFECCHLDEEAKVALLRFCQLTNTECKLRELGFRSYSAYSCNGTTFDGESAGNLAIQLLHQCPRDTNSSETAGTGRSIGSLLERLTFDFTDSSTFWPAYANNASEIRLSYLHLGRLKERDWKDLKQYLPSILYLRELSIDVWTDGVPASTLNQALRRNGSVQATHMKSAGGIPLEELISQTPEEKRLHESILLRNQHVPKLLTSPRLLATGATDGDQAIHDKDSGTPPTLIPPLFQVMAPAEHMQPNTVLQGLLAFKSISGAAMAAAKRYLPIAVVEPTAATVASPISSTKTTGKRTKLATASPDKHT